MFEFVLVRALDTRELVFTPDWREEDDGGRGGEIIVWQEEEEGGSRIHPTFLSRLSPLQRYSRTLSRQATPIPPAEDHSASVSSRHPPMRTTKTPPTLSMLSSFASVFLLLSCRGEQ